MRRSGNARRSHLTGPVCGSSSPRHESGSRHQWPPRRAGPGQPRPWCRPSPARSARTVDKDARPGDMMLAHHRRRPSGRKRDPLHVIRGCRARRPDRRRTPASIIRWPEAAWLDPAHGQPLHGAARSVEKRKPGPPQDRPAASHPHPDRVAGRPGMRPQNDFHAS